MIKKETIQTQNQPVAENEQQPIESEVQTPTPTPQSPPNLNNAPTGASQPTKQSNNWLVLVLIIFLLLSISVAGVFGYMYYQSTITRSDTASNQDELSDTTDTSNLTQDPTSDWETYTNNELGFSFKYPNGWEITQSLDSNTLLAIEKQLPESSINKEYCKPGITDGGTDCYPKVSLELSVNEKPSNYIDVVQSSPCEVFGECSHGETKTPLVEPQVRYLYITPDSLYPLFSYVDLPNHILRFRGYAPSSKNCVGTCPKYTDSKEVTETAYQIKKILSTLKLVSSTKSDSLLASTIQDNCSSNRLSVDFLPISLTDSLKSEYGIENLVDCVAGEESYVSFGNNLSPEGNNSKRVYLYHEQSEFHGMVDEFAPWDSKKELNIEGQGFYVVVSEPGPYGISTNGVWITIKKEIYDPERGVRLRIIGNRIIQSQVFIDLVIKHGNKYGSESSIPDSPDYVLNKENKEEFLQDIYPLLANDAEVKELADSIQSDLDTISF